jgi:uncharacterized paraquat-inducible protein A
MIRVTLPVLVFIYVVALLATVCGAWLLYEWRRRRAERDAFRGALQCVLCGFEFQDHGAETVARCPRCGALNERVRSQRL